jgi:catecholate siderophore receptor
MRKGFLFMSISKSAPSFLALSCVGALAFASSAHGQEAAQSPKLGGMTVTDTAIDESEVKVDKAESPKYTRPLLDTPQTITVINKATIQQQNLLTLRDVLSTVPGITFGAGEGGFGYDPVFYSLELEKSFAEASAAENKSDGPAAR